MTSLQAEKEFLVKLLPPPFWLGALSYMDHLRRKGGGEVEWAFYVRKLLLSHL